MTKSCILHTLFEFLLNPQARVQSGTAPKTSRNYDEENKECNEDRSQDDPHSDV